jgi:hypothetical protein
MDPRFIGNNVIRIRHRSRFDKPEEELPNSGFLVISYKAINRYVYSSSWFTTLCQAYIRVRPVSLMDNVNYLGAGIRYKQMREERWFMTETGILVH